MSTLCQFKLEHSNFQSILEILYPTWRHPRKAPSTFFMLKQEEDLFIFSFLSIAMESLLRELSGNDKATLRFACVSANAVDKSASPRCGCGQERAVQDGPGVKRVSRTCGAGIVSGGPSPQYMSCWWL